MTERYTHDELLDFQDDFTDDSRAAGEPPRVAAAGVPHENADADGGGLVPSGDPPTTREATRLPEQGENERASATAALKRPGAVPATPRFPSGRNNLKDRHAELRKAAIVAALNLACKHTREDEGDMALIQVGVAAWLLRGDDT
jgi:hypothetical protein